MPTEVIPAWQLYGESRAFPDVLHVERIADRAAGLEWRIAPHRHAHLHQVFLLTDGSANVTVDGQAVQMALPGLLNVPHGVAHGFRFAAGTEGYVLTLPLQELPEIFGIDAEPAQGLARAFTVAAEAADAVGFHALAREHAARHPHRRTRLKAMATMIACDMLRSSETGRLLGLTDRPDPRVIRFQMLIDARFREGLGVSAYARELGLSPRHLNRLCRTAVGLSAQGVIGTTTFRQACSLLVYTRMTVAGVAYEVGFQDPSYFTRAFQRHMGLSPTEYRARFDG